MDTSQFVLVPLSLKLSILYFFNFYSVFNFEGGASHGTLHPVRAFPFGCSFFFSLSFNFLFSICHALLSCLNIYLICPIKSLKKKDVPISVNVADDTPIDSRPIP